MMIRIAISGYTNVGKTSIISRFCDDDFSNVPNKTEGVDYKTKDYKVENINIKFHLWDFSGEAKYESTNKLIYSRAQALIIVFDVKDLASFDSLKSKVEEVKREAPSNLLIFLCANKIDLDISEHTVNREMYLSFASFKGVGLFEVSALNGSNITNVR